LEKPFWDPLYPLRSGQFPVEPWGIKAPERPCWPLGKKGSLEGGKGFTYGKGNV